MDIKKYTTCKNARNDYGAINMKKVIFTTCEREEKATVNHWLTVQTADSNKISSLIAFCSEGKLRHPATVRIFRTVQQEKQAKKESRK